MTDPRPDLATLLPELYEPERRRTAPPTTEEILAYLEGELSAEEEARLQDRLALHPQATGLLLDLADPSRLDDEAPAPEPDLEALRRRLRRQGLLDPAPAAFRRSGVHPLYRWAAAALLVVSAGLGLQLARQAAVEPLPTAIWELLPQDDGGQRGGDEEVIAEDGFAHDLILYAPALAAGTDYRVVVLDAGGEAVVSRLTRSNVPGQIVLRLAADDLPPGRYRIRLTGPDETPIATYDLHWRRP
ncbi:MAG: hypothetical protein D6696_01655 [Acidobacteria bacterium]|nr:MAG: hypothetical protein D6696_01655 [Acidobacteriota bacterium]